MKVRGNRTDYLRSITSDHLSVSLVSLWHFSDIHNCHSLIILLPSFVCLSSWPPAATIPYRMVFASPSDLMTSLHHFNFRFLLIATVGVAIVKLVDFLMDVKAEIPWWYPFLFGLLTTTGSPENVLLRLYVLYTWPLNMSRNSNALVREFY